MLSALAYRTFCYKIFNRLINHDDTISEEKLKDHVKQTDIAWKQRNDRRSFLNLPTLPPSRPASPTNSEIEREAKEAKEKEEKEAKEKKEKEKASKIEAENVKKKKSLKKKIIRLMSFKKKKDITIVPLINTVHVISPNIPDSHATPILDPVDIYCDEISIFSRAYDEGTYRPSLPYRYISEEASREKSNDEEKYDEKSDPSKEDCEKEELAYDKEKISFHDRSTYIYLNIAYCVC